MPLDVIRPDHWNGPLFLHVLGAMLVVGTLSAAAVSFVCASRGDTARAALLSRLGFTVMMLGVLPSFILMRLSAEWIARRQGLEDGGLLWIDIGYATADLGGLLIIATLVMSGIGARRTRRSGAEGGRLLAVSGIVACLLLALYVVAVWAMTAKPG